MNKRKVVAGLSVLAAAGIVMLARRSSNHDDRNPRINADPSEGTGSTNITDARQEPRL